MDTFGIARRTGIGRVTTTLAAERASVCLLWDARSTRGHDEHGDWRQTRPCMRRTLRTPRAIARIHPAEPGDLARVDRVDRSLYKPSLGILRTLPGELRHRFPYQIRRERQPSRQSEPSRQPSGEPSPPHSPSRQPSPADEEPTETTGTDSTVVEPPARRRGRPPVSASISAEQVAETVRANLGQAPLHPHDLLSLVPQGQTLKRRQALANASRHRTGPGDWDTPSSRTPTLRAFARQHETICRFRQTAGVHSLVYKTLIKLFDVSFARRWHACCQHDDRFATRFYQQLPRLPDADQATVFKTHKKAIRDQVTRKQQPHVTARNRLLRLFARVLRAHRFIDPSWDYDILYNTANGPVAMRTATAYYDAFAAETDVETRKTLYMHAEAAVIAFADSIMDKENLETVRGQLWELRVHAAFAFMT
ncbi:hypothetical protein BD626DRAFT_495579 [Schizophyllum amplum]|uniref:Uncharacterized protein n=1 Tax=Schizophyllum amplum TaxID=97359 RepID=A0A550CEB1_9AGAR|nr:hypothetical protein BD626DRAFT_495579 [Auriculariopsis ampla]